MIPIKELRVGNYALLNGKMITVDLPEMARYRELEPIELSEDLLARLGLKYNNYKVWVFGNGVHFVGRSWLENVAFNFGEIIQGTYCDVKYLHHIQNLYFDLTNEELTLKD